MVPGLQDSVVSKFQGTLEARASEVAHQTARSIGVAHLFGDMISSYLPFPCGFPFKSFPSISPSLLALLLAVDAVIVLVLLLASFATGRDGLPDIQSRNTTRWIKTITWSPNCFGASQNRGHSPRRHDQSHAARWIRSVCET